MQERSLAQWAGLFSFSRVAFGHVVQDGLGGSFGICCSGDRATDHQHAGAGGKRELRGGDALLIAGIGAGRPDTRGHKQRFG
jgi:hypothetical protein